MGGGHCRESSLKLLVIHSLSGLLSGFLNRTYPFQQWHRCYGDRYQCGNEGVPAVIARWLATLVVLGPIAACGSTAGGATATVTPSTRSASTPTAVPTPTLPPPLAVIQSGSALAAFDAAGHMQWSLTASAVDALVSTAQDDHVFARTAGPNVIISRVPIRSTNGANVVLLDRTGQVVGRGSLSPFDDATQATGVVGSPAGNQWAWSVDDTPSSAPVTQHDYGRILVAGIGVPQHTLFSWVASTGSSRESVAAWTDMGIVMERVGPGGCGIGFHGDEASFLIDPTTGTLTNLFTGGEHYGDARHNVRVAFASRSSAVLVNGITFDGSIASDVFVSPDGSRVGVQRFSQGGCAGVSPTLITEMIDVNTGAHADIAGCGITGWLDTTRFVCHSYGDPTQRIASIDGQPGAVLVAGDFAGALPSD